MIMENYPNKKKNILDFIDDYVDVASKLARKQAELEYLEGFNNGSIEWIKAYNQTKTEIEQLNKKVQASRKLLSDVIDDNFEPEQKNNEKN